MGKKNEARRQSALAKKRAKQRAAAKNRNRTASHQHGRRARAMAAAQSPVRDCLVPVSLFELGIGNIVFSRTMPSGEIATTLFLVDVFCLGVKDAFFEILPRDKYEATLSHVEDRGPLRSVLPSCARKLIEGAVRYADALGIRPHPDYLAAKSIFGDADPATCTLDYEYGREGKPLYVLGPHDRPERSRQILQMLERTCGPDGFDFMLVDGGSMP